MEPKRILVVEDDPEFQEFVRLVLKTNGYEPASAETGDAGVYKARALRPDAVLLDLSLPGRQDGVEVLKALRRDEATRRIPVVIMSALDPLGGVLPHAVQALGVSGYLRKPFPDRELLRLLRPLLSPPARRAAPCSEAPHLCVLELGCIRADVHDRKVWVDGRLVKGIGPRRFDLLCALMRHAEGVSRERLLNEVWAGREDMKTVDMTVHRLRLDLGLTARSGCIQSIPGGYRLVG